MLPIIIQVVLLAPRTIADNVLTFNRRTNFEVISFTLCVCTLSVSVLQVLAIRPERGSAYSKNSHVPSMACLYMYSIICVSRSIYSINGSVIMPFDDWSDNGHMIKVC